jgi:hypothetical protein
MLTNQIKEIYSSLTDADFSPDGGTIRLQNDSDGKGDYIKEWNHPTLAKPTDVQLAAQKPVGA